MTAKRSIKKGKTSNKARIDKGEDLLSKLPKAHIKKTLIIDLIYLAVVVAAIIFTKAFGLWDSFILGL